MKSVVITPKNNSELNFVSKLLTEEEKEDIGLSILLNEVDRDDKVSEEEVLKKLN